MTRPMSRKERKAAFMAKAEQMFAELEAWYDQNPEASFEEIEGQARKARRKMMGSVLSIVVNGRKKRAQEAAGVFSRKADQRVVVESIAPIAKQATLSTDGGIVHGRGEGWKEVKMVAVSAVRPKKETEKGAHPDGCRYKPYEPQLMLEQHSYQAGLWDADEMGQHQYLEGLRRQVNRCAKVSSTNKDEISSISDRRLPHRQWLS